MEDDEQDQQGDSTVVWLPRDDSCESSTNRRLAAAQQLPQGASHKLLILFFPLQVTYSPSFNAVTRQELGAPKSPLIHDGIISIFTSEC